MSRNIVICSDGTGNNFDSRVTNVTRSDGVRDPSTSRRRGKVSVHASVVRYPSIDAEIATVKTKTLPAPF
jgi:hypothetical protein